MPVPAAQDKPRTTERPSISAYALQHQQEAEKALPGQRADDAKVLVIYVGGTIGMLSTPSGLETAEGYLESLLRTQHRFHDPEGESVFAVSQSMSSWKTYQRSRAASPARVDEKTANLPSAGKAYTMTAYTHDGTRELPSLITPRTHTGRRIRYAILEYEKLVDSSDVDPKAFLAMAADVERNYSRFDGFVILHGTDTMAYSASALSFLLENLGKTVVLTGAQIPLASLRNDAVDNLLGALLIAGTFTIAEVCLYFNNSLLRGNRSYKQSAYEFDAFSSPNLPPLASLGIDVQINWPIIDRPTAIAPFRAHRFLEPNVFAVRITPTLTGSILRAILAPPSRGLVLETYGSGNAPNRPDLLDAIREASVRGVIIVNVTQCARGSVELVYALGYTLSAAGVISGLDMTVEAALAKLSYFLSKPALSTVDIRTLMLRPIRGELTSSPSTRYTLVASVDADDGTAYGLHAPELAPTTCADTLAHSARLALPHRISDLAATGPASSLALLLDEHPVIDLDGLAVLHTAAAAGRADCVKVLLERGSSVHARFAGRTPIEVCEAGGDVERLLRTAGAHIEAPRGRHAAQ